MKSQYPKYERKSQLLMRKKINLNKSLVDWIKLYFC
jgi:hypothetical protein